MQVSLQEITEEAERNIINIARVSNPANQNNPEYAKLIKYCITHQHWSVFEHSFMTLEIETSTAIATQILRHRSFTFQQFSQRYADPTQLGFEPIELRRQAEKNRQSSMLRIEEADEKVLEETWFMLLEDIQHLYNRMIDAGVAKECARFILPQCTATRMYMSGNIRSWIHFIQLRCGEDVQLEHRQVALAAKKIFCRELPVTASALEWVGDRGKENP
jgi:thymidylate synthase (FAD)